MKKKNVLKRNIDFDRIIKNNKAFKYKYYIIYLEKTLDSDYHFGLSVGKKIGNAVVRNKVKRQLREIVDQKDYPKGINCIIIVKKGVLDNSFDQMKNDLHSAFKKLNILKEN